MYTEPVMTEEIDQTTASTEPAPATHGTRAAYLKGCKCAECRAAWASYMMDYKRRTGKQKPREVSLIEREASMLRRTLDGLAADSTDEIEVRVPLSPMACRILVEAQERSPRRRGEMIDLLIRAHADELINPAA